VNTIVRHPSKYYPTAVGAPQTSEPPYARFAFPYRLAQGGLLFATLISASSLASPASNGSVADKPIIDVNPTSGPEFVPIDTGAGTQRDAASSKLWPSSAMSAQAAPRSHWLVRTSLRVTLQEWANRQGWPAPQFLTLGDWPVDVPGSIEGTIEDALRALVEGFAKSSIRPRIEVSTNHVMLVSEVGE
jgi:hypothetical protein